MDFDIIPYEDIRWGQRLGAGSFGSVYKGCYLGIDIAIKEVLPSEEYDVHKYFEREWRIMRECRHPNIVLFLGLSKAPGDDGRVFIISEFVPRGNLRQYILSSHPFPWRLRLSFATDVARAVAYLHARQCIHRDLKGENLLITSNERVKVTDFGFARIASRNADEMRRMTYCGTDGYMSPEIINGLEFDLPTDVFSLGIIFIEIMSRKLVDSRTYARKAPHFVPDPAEVRTRASAGCPPALVVLALDCTKEDPLARPKMPEVLSRLREIELEVLSRMDDPSSSEHVGSIRLVHRGGKRAMPIFDGGDMHLNDHEHEHEHEDEKDRQDEEEVLRKLAEIHLDISGKGASTLTSSRNDSEYQLQDEGYGEDGNEKWRTARWNDLGSTDSASVMTFKTASSDVKGQEPLLPTSDSGSSFGSAGTRPEPEQGWSSFIGSPSTPGQPVQTASVLRAATPGPLVSSVSDEAILEEEIGSTMTIRGHPDHRPSAPDTRPPPTSQPNKTDIAPSDQMHQSAILLSAENTSSGDPVNVPNAPQSAVEDTISELETIPSLPGSFTPIKRKDQQNEHLQPSMPSSPTNTKSKPESSPKTASSGNTTSSSSGSSSTALTTHRFTLVDRDSVPLINGKKALSSNFVSASSGSPGPSGSTAVTSTFAFAFLPRALAPSPSPKKDDSTSAGTGRCAVCTKKMGARAGLQCDDCHLIVHVKCSHNAPRNCTGGDGEVH